MKLLVVDDHSIMRAGLAALFGQPGSDVEVLEAGDAAAAMHQVEAHDDLDVVLLDLNMPGEDGMSTLRRISAHRPDLPVILLSSSEDAGDIRRGLAAGALGFVPKSAGPQTLKAALNLVLAGEVYVPTIMLKEAAASPAKAGAHLAAEGLTAKGLALTARQAQVLQLMSEGLSNKQIGRRLLVSERTIKAHITAIFRSMGVSSRAQAMAIVRDTSRA